MKTQILPANNPQLSRQISGLIYNREYLKACIKRAHTNKLHIEIILDYLKCLAGVEKQIKHLLSKCK